MPQLDTTYFVSQFFWLAVCFTIFYACIRFLIIPRLESILGIRDEFKHESESLVGVIDLEITEMKIAAKKQSEATNALIENLEEAANSKFDSYSKDLLSKLRKKIDADRLIAIQKALELSQKMLADKEMNEAVIESARHMIFKITNLDISPVELKNYIKS